MNNQNEIDLMSYFLRIIMAILLGLVITYAVLYASLQFGNNVLFLGGAIVGGYWGNIWNMILFFDKRLLEDPYNNLMIVILIISLIIFLAVLFIIYPLPT